MTASMDLLLVHVPLPPDVGRPAASVDLGIPSLNLSSGRRLRLGTIREAQAHVTAPRAAVVGEVVSNASSVTPAPRGTI